MSILMKAAICMAAGALVVFSCQSERETLKPEVNPNPWADDYSSVSAMADYKAWGTYNVHDPACRKVGDTFYVYSTDAIYRENKEEAAAAGVPMGYIQVRKSRDLVNWEFAGWAFPDIPAEAVSHVRNHAGGRGAVNIWAPYMVAWKDKYRLYYCVSSFAQSISYLGMAESDSPEGPWEQKGCVVKTDSTSVMNAIDPSVVIAENGEQWMLYGSYFGGLYAVQLNPETGLTMQDGDQGHCVARRANGKKDNIEAPEVIYHPGFRKYYLFVSYDPLMTTYNVRVGRADRPEGPFLDMFGTDMKEETNNFPILTHPYRFSGHPGWAGTAHCGVVNDNGTFYLMHQGRLSPDNQMMDLHIRRLYWTADGWPVVSPQRYAGIADTTFIAADFVGDWELILIRDSKYQRNLAAGQILWGEGELKEDEVCVSIPYTFRKDGTIAGEQKGVWSYTPAEGLSLRIGNEDMTGLIPHLGQDWENGRTTVLFTGLEKHGFSVWGKRVK